jgi:hypothetical protein
MLPLKEVTDKNGVPASEQLVPEPPGFKESVVSNRKALQACREQQPRLQDRAVGAHARASGCSTTFAPTAEKQKRGQVPVQSDALKEAS